MLKKNIQPLVLSLSKGSSISQYLILFITTFLLDRITKYYALKLLASPLVLSPLLSFELGFNRGISWGMLYSESSFVFGGVSFAVIAVMLLLLSHTVFQYKLGFKVYAQTIILAGALSNIIDRLWYGGVVDFIKLSWGSWSWPLFNIADIFIVCGALLLLMQGSKKDEVHK